MNNSPDTTDDLVSRRHWVFDMDGTLTVAMHDFDAMRASLQLPPGVPILEALDALPHEQARRKRRELDEMELRMADDAQQQPGASALLDGLQARGALLGICTRNGREIAHATLAACGLDRYFDDSSVVSRDCAPAKPGPEGIQLLLQRWNTSAATAVMVGDYRFDLEAGQRAGCATVHVNVDNSETWPQFTHHLVTSLDELAHIALRR